MTRERILIHRAKTLQDTGAFAALVRLHQNKIRAFLIRLCRDYDRADDLAQETFLKAFQKLATYRGTGSFSSWLFSIAYTSFLEFQRARNRRNEVIADYQAEMDIRTDRYDTISPEQIDLEKALSRLRPDEAAAITLCHSFGYSQQEVAEILDSPLGTINTNILRGKEKLRKILNTKSIIEEVS